MHWASRRLRISVMSAIAALLVMGVVTLVSPWAFGWPAADERQAVLATALHDPRGGHHAIKLVPVNDLPASLNWVSRRQASGNVWVVATSGHLPGEDGELGAPPATWTVQVFLEGAETNVGGTGGTTGLSKRRSPRGSSAVRDGATLC